MRITHVITEVIPADSPPEGPCVGGPPCDHERTIDHQLVLEITSSGHHQYALDGQPIHRDLFDRLCSMQQLQLAEEHIVSVELLHEDVRTLVEMYEQERLSGAARSTVNNLTNHVYGHTTCCYLNPEDGGFNEQQAAGNGAVVGSIAALDWVRQGRAVVSEDGRRLISSSARIEPVSDLRVGDVVRQVGGAMPMTVERILYVNLITCAWFEDGELHRQEFNRGMLELDLHPHRAGGRARPARAFDRPGADMSKTFDPIMMRVLAAVLAGLWIVMGISLAVQLPIFATRGETAHLVLAILLLPAMLWCVWRYLREAVTGRR